MPERPTPHRDPEHDPGRDVDDDAADLTTTATLEPAPLSEPATSRIRRGDSGGLPGDLRGGLESLSGFDLGDVRVHHDSARPAALGAAAYTEGADIHLGPGQEEHLPHEAWHVVQQRQGRVAPTARIGGAAVSDDAHLEQEADSMGARALSSPTSDTAPRRRTSAGSGAVQLKWGQYDGKERDRVRGVLQAVGRLEPFPYEIAGVLEDLVHDHAAVADADLQTAVQHLADHLTSLPRARAITDALAAGTAHGFVDLGCRVCTDDSTLPAALAAVRELGAVPGFAALDDRDKVALVAERGHLTTDLLRANAVSLAQQGKPGEATAALTRTRAFGYREDVETHVGEQADKHAQTITTAAKQKISGAAVVARGKAVTDELANAEGALSNSLRKDLKAGTGTTKYQNAVKKRSDKQQELAAPAIGGIDAQEQTDLTHVDTVTGPQAKQDKTQEYTTWLASVGHHPKALDALKAAGEDRGLAESLLGAIDVDARVGAVLLEGKLTALQLTHVVDVPAAVLGVLVAGGLTAKQVGAFGASENHASLLAGLGAVQVPVARIQDLIADLERFRPEIGDDDERAALATLLVGATPAQVLALRQALPKAVNPKLAALVPLLPKAADPAELATVLAFCDKAGWTGDLIHTTITGVPDASALAVLQDAVHAAELGRFAKLGEFASWLYAVDRLVGAGYLTIAANGTWRRLPGDTMVTDEQKYDVKLAAGGAVQDTFVVHYHPGASGASVGNANASKAHLKPRPGGDERYKSPDTLKSVRPKIQLRPPA